MVSLAQVAEALGRPLDALQELDRRPLRLAFVAGRYETVVVRDRTVGATVEATLDAMNGERVDPSQLRRRDRELADSLAASLEPRLRDLVLSHPELAAVRVAVTRAGSASAFFLRTAASDIAALAQQPDVTRIELADDPEIRD